MKTLKQILEDHEYSNLEIVREDILDNEYLLKGGSKNKREYAIKNLNKLFYGDFDKDMPEIEIIVDEFLEGA